MKALFKIVFFLLCVQFVNAQEPIGSPTINSTGWARYKWLQGILINDNLDTTAFVPRFAGTMLYRPADGKLYYYDSVTKVWQKLSIGSDVPINIATASLTATDNWTQNWNNKQLLFQKMSSVGLFSTQPIGGTVYRQTNLGTNGSQGWQMESYRYDSSNGSIDFIGKVGVGNIGTEEGVTLQSADIFGSGAQLKVTATATPRVQVDSLLRVTGSLEIGVVDAGSAGDSVLSYDPVTNRVRRLAPIASLNPTWFTSNGNLPVTRTIDFQNTGVMNWYNIAGWEFFDVYPSGGYQFLANSTQTQWLWQSGSTRQILMSNAIPNGGMQLVVNRVNPLGPGTNPSLRMDTTGGHYMAGMLSGNYDASDSLITINGLDQVKKRSISSFGFGVNNTNVGAGFRVLNDPSTQTLRTLFNSNTLLWDSTSNANGLTAKVDTTVIATQYDLTQIPSLALTAGTGIDIVGDSINTDSVPYNAMVDTDIYSIVQDTIATFYRNDQGSTVKRGDTLVMAFTRYTTTNPIDLAPCEIYIKRSWDNGKTWSTGATVITGGARMAPSLYIQNDGDLLLIYRRMFAHDSAYVLKRVSSDGGYTWSADVRINPDTGYTTPRSDAIYKDINGRLWFGFNKLKTACITSGCANAVGKIMVSDDDGDSWSTLPVEIVSPDSLVTEQGFYNVDSLMLMYWRTRSGWVFGSTSKDNGITWSRSFTLNFRSPNSQATITKYGRNYYAVSNVFNGTINGLQGRIGMEVLTSTNGYDFMSVRRIEYDTAHNFIEPWLFFDRNILYTWYSDGVVTTGGDRYILKQLKLSVESAPLTAPSFLDKLIINQRASFENVDIATFSHAYDLNSWLKISAASSDTGAGFIPAIKVRPTAGLKAGLQIQSFLPEQSSVGTSDGGLNVQLFDTLGGAMDNIGVLAFKVANANVGLFRVWSSGHTSIGNLGGPTTGIRFRVNGVSQLDSALLWGALAADPAAGPSVNARSAWYNSTTGAFKGRDATGSGYFALSIGGTATRVPVWSSASRLVDFANFTFDNTNSILTLGGTSSIKIPVGTTAQRPTGAAGYGRSNSDSTNLWEYFDGTNWQAFASRNWVRSLGFATGNTMYTGDGTATNRTLTISGFLDLLGGEVKIGSASDEGPFSLQNTGGLYQNGTVALRGTLASVTPYAIITKETDSTFSLLTTVPATMGGVPSGGTSGQVLTKNSGTNYDYSWTTPSGGSGVTTIGAILDPGIHTKSANGAVIVGTDLFMQPADATYPGLVTVNAQTLAGLKTFPNSIIAQTSSSSVSKLSLTGNVSGAGEPGVFGLGLAIDAYTYTDGGASRTVSNVQQMNKIANPTLEATNAVTYTTAANLYVMKPTAGTNITITQNRSLYALGIAHAELFATGINEGSSGTVSMVEKGLYVSTGTTATYTLPDRNSYLGVIYFVKNAGSGDLTVQRAGSDQLYDTAAVNDITIPAGQSRLIVGGANYWYVFNL